MGVVEHDRPRSAIRLLTQPLQQLLSLIAPGECAVCAGPLLHTALAPVCELCLLSLKPAAMLQCSSCGEALGIESEWMHGSDAELSCSLCRLAPPPYRRATSFGVYEGTMRQMIHRMKFHEVPALTRPLGHKLGLALCDLQPTAPLQMTVLSVPLYGRPIFSLFRAKRRRSFNQSTLLAQRAVRLARKRHPAWDLREDYAVLQRIRATESQFQLSPSQRRTNLKGAFRVSHPDRVAGRHLLLIDDIYTTGATARECTRVLLAAGAASVHILTLARTQMGQVAERWQPGTILGPTSFGSAAVSLS